MTNQTVKPVVSSYNEWDPLEEMIVGVIDGATVPEWDLSIKSTMPKKSWDFFKERGGKHFPKEFIDAAREELEEFVHILEAEGVKVVRPRADIDFAKPFSTPDWSSKGGLYAAMPRDLLLIIGDEIIEAPMSWRSRYFEIYAYRDLIQDYFSRGAKWTCAPKPQLTDDLYRQDHTIAEEQDKIEYVLTEAEPVFDAADFMRCGKHILYQLSNVTNQAGVNWLQSHLSDEYKFVFIEGTDSKAMHIDVVLMPLAPGKILVNPDRVKEMPAIFKGWDVFHTPLHHVPEDYLLYMSSPWLNTNIIMLDHKRVIVEAQETNLIECFKKWGFNPIPCAFKNVNRFGGSFHCVTADVRRRGKLENYF